MPNMIGVVLFQNTLILFIKKVDLFVAYYLFMVL